MSSRVSEQLTRLVPETDLLYSVRSFLLDGESRRLSPRRLGFSRRERNPKDRDLAVAAIARSEKGFWTAVWPWPTGHLVGEP